MLYSSTFLSTHPPPLAPLLSPPPLRLFAIQKWAIYGFRLLRRVQKRLSIYGPKPLYRTAVLCTSHAGARRRKSIGVSSPFPSPALGALGSRADARITDKKQDKNNSPF